MTCDACENESDHYIQLGKVKLCGRCMRYSYQGEKISKDLEELEELKIEARLDEAKIRAYREIVFEIIDKLLDK